MTCPNPAPFAFTQLTEPGKYADPTLPAGLDVSIALLLAKACNLSYTQLAQNTPTLTAEQIASLGGEFDCKQVGAGITVSESIATGAKLGSPGLFSTVPAGFALSCTPSGGGQAINLIAIRGTRTYSEWISDVEAIPQPWHVGNNNGNYYSRASVAPLGMVHGGFYSLYNQGTDGLQPESVIKEVLWVEYTRPDGSIAAQIETLMGQLDRSLPLYVTGHSLGAALAVLCAMDIGTNFPKSFPEGELSMINFAGPLVAAGIKAFNIGYDTDDFITPYTKAVAKSYRIVNSADIVPILPPPCLDIGSDIEATFAHVTPDPISFCAQTGTIGGNHSIANTYLPYVETISS